MRVIPFYDLWNEIPGEPMITEKGEEIKEVPDGYEVFYGRYSSTKRKPCLYWEPIKKIIRHWYRGKIYRVNTNGGFVEVTPNHSVLKRVHSNQYKEKVYKPSDLRVGDELPTPKVCSNYKGRRRFFGVYQKHPVWIGDKDLAWLYGIFAAEGSCPRGKNVVKICCNTDSSILDKAYKIAQRNFHGVHIHRGENTVIAANENLWKFFREKFYTSKGEKKVPQEIFEAPDEIVVEFLKGYTQGDGVKKLDWNQPGQSFGGKSYTLALGLYILYNRLGIPNNNISVYIREDKPNIVQCQVLAKTKDPGVIKKISTRVYEGYVYDLETTSHNFTSGVGLIRVHNTGCSRVHEQTRRVIFETTIPAQHRDENGHGTHVTSLIGGVVAIDEYLSQRSRRRILCEGMAPRCGLLAIKSLGYIVGMGSTSNIIEALDIAIERGSSIVNLSLGGPCEVETPQEDPYFDVFEEVLRYNVIPVVAAGNSGPASGTIESPGAMPNVLTVGAYDPITGKIAPFSSRGPTRWNAIKPDIVMPGVNIDSATDGVCDTAGDGVPSRYSPLSGTSMATPTAAGLIVLMRQCHRDVLGKILTLDEIKTMMEELGHEKNPTSGWGAMTWLMYEHWLSSQYGVEL